MSSSDEPTQGRAEGRLDTPVKVTSEPDDPRDHHGRGAHDVRVDADGDSDGSAMAPAIASGGPIRHGSVLGGRYRVAERVGAGGMATIYRGFDLVLERSVAVKVLHAHLAGDPELQARFRTEARHAAALSHPHIVAVYDQGLAELPYIVMELVDGPSLREVLNARGPLSAPEALAVVEPIARALSRAHRVGVVHRDIKPENVLVAVDGTPKVADFGIARVVAGTSHTQTGALIGSVHYLAPELVDGAEASRASDQYALGVVLYELMTGRRPFAGDTPMAVALRHTRDRVPAPSTQGAGCGPAVDAVVTRATAHDAADRYPDLDAFADAFRDAVPGGAAELVVEGGPDGTTLVIPAKMQEGSATVVTTPQEPLQAPPVHAPATTAGPSPGTTTPGTTSPGTTNPGTTNPETTRQQTATGGGGSRRHAGSHQGRAVRRVLLVSLLTLLLLGAAAGGAYAWWHYLVAPITPVPPLTGLTEDEAFEVTSALELGLSVDDLRYDFDAPEGHVIEQDPPPDTEVRRGDAVSVVLSRGPEPLDMPNVVGLSEAEAIEKLRAERLEVSVTSRHDDDAPEGDIVDQDPPVGATLRQGDAVEIVRSLGIEQVGVPTLVGQDIDDVETLLAGADLELGDVTRVWSDARPTAGEVIDQSLEGGTTVDKGSVVDVSVSRGPLTIEMPEVRGEPVGEARDALEARALEVEVVEQPRPRFGPIVRGTVGLVEEQLPASGTSVQRGDTVTLYTFAD